MKRNIEHLFKRAASWGMLCGAILLGATTFVEATPHRAEAPASRMTDFIISEIMYKPESPQVEYIELFNTAFYDIDISGLKLKGQVDYTFPTNTVFAQRSYIIITKDPAAIQGAPVGAAIYGPWSGGLSNGGGKVKIFDRFGTLHCEVDYTDSDPWPISPDLFGHSLVMNRPDFGQASPLSWSQSAKKGGSPGSLDVAFTDPLSQVCINEFSIDTVQQTVSVEFLNRGTTSVDLKDCTVLSTDDSGYAHLLSASTPLLAKGYTTVSIPLSSSFALSLGGSQLALQDPTGERILDVVDFAALPDGESYGRYPNGSQQWRSLSARSLGTANATPVKEDVIINEIMYHPFSDSDAEEYIELYNRSSTPIALDGWKLSGGLSFTFPAGASIPAHGYIVVAADAPALIAQYSQLTSANTFGNFSGTLGNSGDRILLKKPLYMDPITLKTDYQLVGKVHYMDYWSQWADGGGSSLELRSTESDPSLEGNWGDSDESSKSTWTTIDYSDTLFDGDPNADVSFILDDNKDYDGNLGKNYEFQMQMQAAGECLVDNIEVKVNGVEQLTQGDFETNLNDWDIPTSNHDQSFIDATYGGADGSAKALHIIATSAGEGWVNHIEQDIGVCADGDAGQFKAKARWLRGSNAFLMRLRGAYLEQSILLDVPSNLGSPGQANSIAAAQVGPAIGEILHYPVLPSTQDDVVVTAEITDINGVQSAQILYDVDGAGSYSVTMRDDGIAPDAIAADGLYSGTIPAQADEVLVGFRISATDTLAQSSEAPNSQDGWGQALISWGDGTDPGDFNSLRIWMPKKTYVDTFNVQLGKHPSDDLLNTTLIYNRHRIIHNAGLRFRGSVFTREKGLSYKLKVRRGPELLGDRSQVLDGAEEDDARLREWSAYWVAEQIGVAAPHKRWQYVYLNDNASYLHANYKRVFYADATRPSQRYLDSRFPGESDGSLHIVDRRIDLYDRPYMPTGVDHMEIGMKRFYDFSGSNYYTPIYRMGWGKKTGDVTDFSDFYHLMDTAFDANSASLLPDLIDGYQIMRAISVRMITSDRDGYGWDSAKNAFMFKPSNGKWKYLLWDLDLHAFSGGATGSPANKAIYPAMEDAPDRFPGLTQMYLPEYQRAFYQSMKEVSETGGIFDRLASVIDQREQALINNGVPVTGTQEVKDFATARKAKIASDLAKKGTPTTFTSTERAVRNGVFTIVGTGPLDVYSIRINGRSIPLQWVSFPACKWRADLKLAAGNNDFTIQAYDRNGNPIYNPIVIINITPTSVIDTLDDSVYPPLPLSETTAIADPLGSLIISEVMYHPVSDPNQPDFSSSDYEFVELYNTGSETLWLGDLSFTGGINLSFDADQELAAGSYGVVVANRDAFIARYGTGIHILAEFSKNLSDSGESIKIEDGGGRTITKVDYKDNDPWPIVADGLGPSISLPAASTNYNASGNEWVNDVLNGSPGSAYVPLSIAPIQISEILTHTDLPQVDYIELYNPTASAVNIGGWFLTDDRSELKKFRIPDNTMLAADSYLTFYETNTTQVTASHFGPEFSLSSHGESVYLSSGSAQSNLTGYITGALFDAAKNGVSFGLVTNSLGTEFMAAQVANTPDAINSDLKIGPLVISEILPASTNSEPEFVELINIGGSTLNLYDDTQVAGKSNPNNTFKIGGINFEFPLNISITNQEVVVLTDALSEQDFRAAYPSTPAGTKIFTYTGTLDGGGERLSIQFADPEDIDPVDGSVYVPYIVMDEVRYDTAGAWPSIAGSGAYPGHSMQRIDNTLFGNEPTNWVASASTGGSPGEIGLIAGPPPPPLPPAVRDGLSLHYTFDEGSGGIAADSSGNQYDGVLQGTPTWEPAGKYDAALAFDHVSDYIDAPASLGGSNELTISFWAYATEDNYMTPLDKMYDGQAVANKTGWSFRFKKNGLIGFEIGDELSKDQRITTPSAAYEPNKWVHVAATVDNAAHTVKLYINGVMVKTKTDLSDRTDNTVIPLRIGGRNNDSDRFRGTLDDVQLFDRVLDAAELADVMNNVAPPPPAGFVGWAQGHSLSGASALDTADPDQDGFNNLVEYALSLNPNSPDVGPLTVKSKSSTQMTVHYPKNTLASDVTVQLEGCDDLSAPSWGIIQTTSGGAHPTADTEWREATINIASPTTYFIRVKVIK